MKMGIKRFSQGMGIVAAAAAVICSVCFVHGVDVAVKGMKHSNRNEIRPYVSMADAFVQGDSMVYADGWYYYCSQLDHYYLYRAREDGTEQTLLAKMMPESIYVDGDTVYFLNINDDMTLYRVGTDGSGLCRLSDISLPYLKAWGDYFYFSYADSLYRIKKDGSNQELLVEGYVLQFVTDGERLTYILSDREARKYLLYHADMNGENRSAIWELSSEKISWFDMELTPDFLYCEQKDETGRLYRLDLADAVPGEQIAVLPDGDWRIADGSIYCMTEEKKDGIRTVRLYRLTEEGPDRAVGKWRSERGEEEASAIDGWELLYENTAQGMDSTNGYWGNLASFYVTEKHIFVREFWSVEEGVLWVALDEEMQPSLWEDSQQVPVVTPAVNLEYGELSSVIMSLHTPDYSMYMAEDLTYEDSFGVYGPETAYGEFSIRLPQFNEEIEGYQKINRFFQERYEWALEEKERFYKEDLDIGCSYFEKVDYEYMYLDEDYLTVSGGLYGWIGGIRAFRREMPVTFDRQSGEALSLGDLFAVPEEEAMLCLFASIYKYMECSEMGSSLELWNATLWHAYDVNQFYLTEDGIGLYYAIYAIGPGAAGDFLFVIPYEAVADILAEPLNQSEAAQDKEP
ncbi:MAG: DUF5050 domain-containing protein [Lachnospiraceae bacterium]|nr:DUF5050 domain-containing protein [Lachnospiraceae bacterium]